MRYFLPLILILLVVIVSGCIPTGPITMGNGIVIDSFEPVLKDVYSKEPVQFRLKITNIGSQEAVHVRAEILGLEDWVGGDNLERPRSGSTSLLPPNVAYGTPGASASWTFGTEENLRAPEMPKKSSISYQATARVYYEYKSSAMKSLTLLPQKEAIEFQDLGKSLPSETVSSSSGPITLKLEIEGPVRVSEGAQIEFPLKITIQNTGGGTVCKNRCSIADDLKKISYRITKSNDIIIDPPECAERDVTLVNGDSASLTCYVRALSIPDKRTKTAITIESEYEYYLDTETSINVLGAKAQLTKIPQI